MFEHKTVIKLDDIETEYASIKVKNIVFTPKDIEEAIPNIIFEDDNLQYVFQEDVMSDFNLTNMYKRFIPQVKIDNIEEFIKNEIKSNKSFYTFLAEAILTIVYRDIYKCNLAAGVIDVRNTLTTGHTGVDSCMYNIDENIIVLGEAKFYENVYQGFNSIIKDFKTNSIRSKLESLSRIAQTNEISQDIVLKNLKLENYDMITMDEFMKLNIVFAGFVLHSETLVKPQYDKEFYEKVKIDRKDIESNIVDSFETVNLLGDYNIIMIHLPIQNKKELIEKVIEKAQSKLKGGATC